MSWFSSDKNKEEKKPTVSMQDLLGAASTAMVTGNWSGVLDLVKPLLAPGIGGKLIEHDKEVKERNGKDNSNCCYIITKKVDDEGNLNVFLSVIERPEKLEYVKDAEGNPIVKDIGDLMDLITGK